MGMLNDLKMYGRFSWRLGEFLRHRITLEEARATVRRHIAERDQNFLHVVERGIFGYPRSPYRLLLKLAGCEFGDLQNMVRVRGVEATLRSLREAGVYVSFEEFKGRTPIVRDGHVINVHAQDFTNPYLSAYYFGRTGGTTGSATQIPFALEHLSARVSSRMVTYDAYGALGIPTAIWLGVPPDFSGFATTLQAASFGQPPRKWFSPITGRNLNPPLRHRLATPSIVIIGRLCGTPIPWPEPVGPDQAAIVARWAAEMLQAHGSCLIHTTVSLALRIANAAWEEGLDLTGATLLGGSEPATPAKVRGITRTGARWLPHYASAESGAVGMGCVYPVDGEDVHFYKDHLALIQYPRQVPGTDITVDAFHFTTLLSTAPKLMLNVESDDYGILEERSCGCPLENCGYTEHIREIRSFRKLTGEGVTLVGSDMIRILEEVLPTRFGGTPLDYQLLEEEDNQGFTRLSLIVSPKVAIADEQAVIDVLLQAMGQSNLAANLARATWTQAKTLRIKRMEPVWTARGKLNPLHLISRAAHRVKDSPGSLAPSRSEPLVERDRL